MKLEQMKEGLIKKMTQEGFDKKFTEFNEDAKGLGFVADELDNYLVRRFVAYMTKVAAGGGSSLERVEAEVILLTRKVNDYGKIKKYNEALKPKR